VATVMAAYLRARYQFVAESALDKSNWEQRTRKLQASLY
jgi:hypothetical protein